MKKIGIIMSSMIGGGAEKMILYIANSLVKEKKIVKLFLFKKVGVNLKKLDSKIEVIDLNSKINFYGILKLIWKLKQTKDLDYIFTSLGPLNAVLACFLFAFRGQIVIARETNIPSIINKIKSKENKIYKIIDMFYKITYKYYDKIIVQSEDMREDLVNTYYIDAKKIKKINNLIDNQKIKKLLKNKTKEIDELFVENKMYGIALGRLTEQKGFDLLIEKSKSLKNSNIVIYILGEGEQYKFLNNQIKNYGLENNVKLLGFKENPYLYLKRADFFVLPSRVEGFPNALIEALAVGLPAIVNNCKGGINEIIISEFNGEIIDFEDKNLNLEEIIKKVIKYDKDMIIQNTIDRFSKEKILDQYMEIFNF